MTMHEVSGRRIERRCTLILLITAFTPASANAMVINPTTRSVPASQFGGKESQTAPSLMLRRGSVEERIPRRRQKWQMETEKVP
jgi:hypothetical protein